MSLSKKEKLVLPDIRTNAGITRAYNKAIMKVMNDIRKDVHDTLVNEFKKQAKFEKKLAQDGISDWVAHVLDLLISKWRLNLDQLSPKIAQLFLNKTVVNYDAQIKRHMRNAGFTVRLQLTDYQKQALQSVLGENVGLIRSISSRYFDDIQNNVWLCIQHGYDLKRLSQNLEKSYGVTKRRAAFIARDQSAKAHAAIEKARRQELGITKAIWVHSHAGEKPRPSHLKADGTEFDIEKGLYLDGQWVLPGWAINCRCTSRSIIEGIIQ